MAYDVEIEDIAFTSVDGAHLLGRLYWPKGAQDVPALVDVHGGAWANNDRRQNESMSLVLAGAGIAVFALDFRSSGAAPYPASVTDVNIGIRWLKAHIARRGERAAVGALGTSSGGHLMLLNALRPDDTMFAGQPLPDGDGIDARLAFAVACWPISDPAARYAMAERDNPRLAAAHRAYFGATGACAEGSPQAIVESGLANAMPPILLLQGTADNNVTPDMADRFAAAYRAAGGAITLETFEGEPHSFTLPDPSSAATARAMRSIVDFVFAQHGGIADARRGVKVHVATKKPLPEGSGLLRYNR